MSIQDYKCVRCEHIEEKFLKHNYETLPIFVCPECGGVMRASISAPNIHLDDSFPGAAIKRGK